MKLPTPSDQKTRRPAAFTLEPESTEKPTATQKRAPQSFASEVTMTPDEDDPFVIPDDVDATALPVATPKKTRFSFGKLALGALGVLFSLAFGLWADQLVRDLFTRSDWLGYTASAALILAVFAVLVLVGREVFGIMRLNAVQALKADAEAASLERSPTAARAIVARLNAVLSHRAETAKGRAALKETDNDVIDGPHLIDLAERELLIPLDRQARALILNASKRVSVVTAVSPRAIVDLSYVLFEVTRLVRAMAELYGGRPGTLGMLRLLRDVVAHLAVTGSIAVGDGLAQQVLGHGLASKLSARLGEGVINGLMTARIGIAAMDLCRPLPFRAVKRPGIGDFVSDLTPDLTGGKTRENA
ncbi:YcjF family protein [Rhizobium sp. RM]|uniref:YcjF family protein n=1 Tax=Rhizobium/Agrobacterium group TaxID=227290 RepID=UPI00110DF94C|nr:YcjF family protein [Rhizobium sp. RM]NWJ22980.1 TIGR01620 family protein [Rhizobium sp. RM]TMV12130.1 TIGR01620 family protein [Rhizobium sp. Td3]